MGVSTASAPAPNTALETSAGDVSGLFGFAAACALVLAGLGALRADGLSLVLVWLACAGSAALVLGPALLGARALRSHRRMLGFVLLGPLAALGPVMLFGQVIKSATHHRPLGAMTYALAAAIVLIGVWLVVARLLTFVEAGKPSWLRLASGLGLGGLLLASLALCVRGLLQLGAYMGPVLLDTTLILAVSLSVCFVDVESKLTRLPPKAGGLLWALVVVGGCVAAGMLGQRLVAVSPPMSVLSLFLAP